MRPRILLAPAVLATAGLLAAAAAGGCSSSSDATPDTVPDASRDATVRDTGSTPGDDAGDDEAVDSGAGADAADDAGKCTPYDASALDDAAVASGRAFVQNVFRCAGCHQSTPVDAGITLSGRTTSLSDAGPVFPPNLTPDPGTGLGCWTDDQIARAILDGVDDEGATLCVMPHFGQPAADGGPAKMDAGTAQEVIAFLRSLAPVVNQVTETQCPALDGGADGGH